MAILVDSYSESNHQGGDFSFMDTVARVGQSFTADERIVLNSAKFYMKKNGDPTGQSFQAKLYTHAGDYGLGGYPTGSALAVSNIIDGSAMPADFGLVKFNFTGANKFILQKDTHYCIVCEIVAGSGSYPNYVSIAMDYLSGPPPESVDHDGNEVVYVGYWGANEQEDLIFYVYGDQVSPLPTFFA